MTRDTEPKVWWDFEFAFLHGVAPVNVTIADGRWEVARPADDVGVRSFSFHYDDGTVEELLIQLHALAYVRTVRREEPPPSHVEDGGRTKVVGTMH